MNGPKIRRMSAWVFGLVAAAVGTVVAALWLSGPFCAMGCDTVATGDAARAQLAQALTHPLPSEAEVTHVLTGGFQDRFAQFRITAPETALPAVLALFDADRDTLAPAPNRRIGTSAAPWWPTEGLPGMRETAATLAGYDETRLAVGAHPERPGTMLVFVFASQF